MNHLDKAVRLHAHVLLSMVPGVREGSADAIHDARVATRRLRAALPIAWSQKAKAELSKARRRLRRTGRALGRARDLDVALSVLEGAELKVPAASGPICQLRGELTSRQERERRRLIKRIDKFSLPEVDHERPVLSAIEWRTDPRWPLLERKLVERADRLGSAIEAAGGVFFPNRLHAVRLHAKRLRYLLELVPTSSKGLQRASKRLRKAQEVLGTLRDRQATADIVADAAGEGGTSGRLEEYQALRTWLEADVRALHTKYLEHRAALQETCDAVRRAVADGACRPWTVTRALVTAGAFAAPSAVALMKRRLAAAALSGAGRDGRPGSERLERRVERAEPAVLSVPKRANATPSA